MKFIGIIISLLIIGYFIIDYSVSNFKLNIGGAEVPAYQTQDIKNLYTDSCSSGNYITFKNNGSDYKTTNLSKILVKLILCNSSELSLASSNIK